VNLARLVDPHPDAKPALSCDGRVVTYGELRAEAAALRVRLAALGVGRGDRVAIVAGNRAEFVVAFLAVVGAGAVAVPLDPESPDPERARQLGAVEPAAVLVAPSGAAASGGGGAEVLEVRLRRGTDLQAVGGLPDGSTGAVADVAPEQPAVALFTSGTAGAPRPALLSHGNLVANLGQLLRLRGRILAPEDVTLGVLPLHHVYGLTVVLGLSLAVGARVVLLERFDPSEALARARAEHVSVAALVPPMVAALAAVEEAARVPSLRLVVSGAAALPAEVGAAFEARFGLPVHQGYGLTEASPVVTMQPLLGPDGAPVRPRPGLVGTPLPGVELRLLDEGEDALVGDPGEILVRGPNVFLGYDRDPEATAEVLDDDGFLHTGDVGVLSDDGELAIVDRRKDLVIVSGFNVFPAEVEAVLSSHPAVLEAAAVGVPDERTGEAVEAFVVKRPGAELDEQVLRAYCASRLARYKCPRRIAVVPALPEDRAGKVRRRELRPGAGGSPSSPGRR
jgi:long-chain acyl-CoA synthetase